MCKLTPSYNYQCWEQIINFVFFFKIERCIISIIPTLIIVIMYSIPPGYLFSFSFQAYRNCLYYLILEMIAQMVAFAGKTNLPFLTNPYQPLVNVGDCTQLATKCYSFLKPILTNNSLASSAIYGM